MTVGLEILEEMGADFVGAVHGLDLARGGGHRKATAGWAKRARGRKVGRFATVWPQSSDTLASQEYSNYANPLS